MQNPLKNKETCSVMVVEPASSVRQMIVDVLKDLGFKKITGMSSGKDALHYLEVERVDWILTSLLANDTVNALQILRLITQQTKLRGTLTSLFLEPDQDDSVLATAFELGLLSSHIKSYVRESINDELEQLLTLLKVHDWNTTLSSAEFIRSYLGKHNMMKSRNALEESLLAMFPGSTSVLYNLAEAEFIQDHKEKAAITLSQIELIDEKMKPHCKRLREKYLGTSEVFVDKFAAASNVLGIKNAIYIDPDTDVLHHGRELLENVGVKDVQTFEDGTAAYDWLVSTKKEPDLVIMEWRISGINGPILVQRIRNLGFHQVPIIVISSLIKRDDIHILREMGVDECHEKPFDHNAFYGVVIWAIQQNRSPTEQKSLQLKIKRLLRADKIGEAERLMGHFFSDERINAATKKEIEAEYFLAKGDLVKARDLGIEALKLAGDSLEMLNLVGKTMLLLKQFDGALRCFEKANSISSLNVDRMLNIAEASIETDDPKKAHEAIEQAKNLDPTNAKVIDMECKVHITSGDSESAKELMNDLESGRNIIAYMNNRAVALAKGGRFEDGINLYKKTIESIPSAWKALSTAVTYNLGLAYARYGDLEQATQILSQIQDKTDYNVAKRAKSLMRRVEQSITTNSRLILSEDTETEHIADESVSEQNPVPTTGSTVSLGELMTKMELKRGDLCCHMIFYNVETDVTHKLLETTPQFKERSSIPRSENPMGSASGKKAAS